MTTIVIVAGGMGTRIRSELGETPKVLAPLGNRNNLDRILRLSAEYGYKKAIILAGYGVEYIEEFVSKNENSYPLSIQILVEQEPLGTAGCFNLLREKVNDRLFVIYGDILCDFNMKRFEDYHVKNNADSTILLQPTSHMSDSDLISLNQEGEIDKIYKKPHSNLVEKDNLANAAVYLIENTVLNQIPNHPCDWIHDIFARKVANGERVMGYISWEFFQDFGTPKRFEKANADIANGIFGARRAFSLSINPLILNAQKQDLISAAVLQQVSEANTKRIPIILFGPYTKEVKEHLVRNGLYIDIPLEDKAYSDGILEHTLEEYGLVDR